MALIIANSQYQHINTLQNPLADGQAVAARLQQAGFTLLRPVRTDSDVQADLNLNEMLKADEALEKAAQEADMVLVFYTGHGLQMDGVAYLLPVELPSVKAESLDSEANRKLLKRRLLELDDLIANLDRHAKVVVAMFDACREIPQLEESSKAVFGGASPFRGLARPLSNGRHRLLAYSASSGELARDGRGQPHSPYLQAWLDEFDRNAGRKDLISFFSDVAVQVPDSKGQNPELVISGIPSGTFYFKPPQASPPVTDNELQQAKERIRQLEAVQAQQAAVPPVKPKTDSVSKTESVYGIEMVNIPGGTFQMGCGPKNGKCETDEKPRHRVTVKPFAIGKTEITQGQWKAVMGSNPSHFKDCGEDCPVENVFWNDVKEFIKTLNRKTGLHYRLPSEAEWEYACRAGQDTRYCGGNDADTVAWYKDNSSKTTHPVGGKQPNAFGLYDMSGNVWELVQDCYYDSYAGKPDDGTAWQEDQCADYRVVRGGSWGYNVKLGRREASALRDQNYLYDWHDGIGFRLALPRSNRH